MGCIPDQPTRSTFAEHRTRHPAGERIQVPRRLRRNRLLTFGDDYACQARDNSFLSFAGPEHQHGLRCFELLCHGMLPRQKNSAISLHIPEEADCRRLIE